MTMKTPPVSLMFDYEVVRKDSIRLTMPLLRKTLRRVQEQLLTHQINGGGKKLRMDMVTSPNKCGMAACIGGWTSLLLLGFESAKDNHLEDAADCLFSQLINLDHRANDGVGLLSDLFHSYQCTIDFNEPNVAATAIGRYLRGRNPWPCGEMPNVLPYTTAAKKRATRK